MRRRSARVASREPAGEGGRVALCSGVVHVAGGFAFAGSREDALGDAEPMHFGRAVVNAERAEVREDPGDDRFIGDALAAQHLHATVDDAPRRFGNDHLRTARLVQCELAAVEHPRAMPDREPRDVEVHVVVGQHESDAFVLADRLAERVPAACVIDRDVVRAPRSAQPAHAVRQPGG